MKVKKADIYQAIQVFQKIMNEPTSPKGAYWLSKLGVKIQAEFKSIEAVRGELVRKYADPQTEEQKEQGNYSVKEKQVDFFKEFNEILGSEVDIDIPILKFEYISEMKLSPVEMGLLENFVEMPQE